MLAAAGLVSVLGFGLVVEGEEQGGEEPPSISFRFGDFPFHLGGGDTQTQTPSDADIEVSLNGFALFNYRVGNRFADAIGNDQFGIHLMGLETNVVHENYRFVAALGSTLRSDIPADTSFRDLFFVWSDIMDSKFRARIGAQPTLFGLKPNGFPGDRSIEPSLEFGGAGGFAVSNQLGPAIIIEHPLTEDSRIEFGVFDSASTTSGTQGSLDGSGLYKNFFAQVRFDRLGIDGLYGSAGYEGRYVGQVNGNRIDDIEPIISVGAGYVHDQFDASLEIISLDRDITGTRDRETYYIAEFSFFATENWTGVLDYARAQELDNQTFRIGAIYDFSKYAAIRFEYAHDQIDVGSDADSVAAMFILQF